MYIVFDPFSLIDQKFIVCCGLEQKEVSKRLISMSIYDAITGSDITLEDLYHPTKTPAKNIVDVFTFLQQKHGDETKTVHFLIDEFNQEILTTKYSTQLHVTLHESFKESTVVIALQSVNKDRTICSADKQIKFQTDSMDVASSGMKPFELTTCVRMSSQLHRLQRNLEAEIETEHFVAPLTFKGIPYFFI